MKPNLPFMKNLTVLLLLFLGLATLKAQVVPSSCTAPDSVVKLYSYDADRLTMRKTFQNSTPWKDSIAINPIIRDTLLKALLAVYNATGLPATDTVVNIAQIHARPDRILDELVVRCDTNVAWGKELSKGKLITGNAYVDSLIVVGSFNRVVLLPPGGNGELTITLIAPFNQNLKPLATAFWALPGVQFALANYAVGGYELNITDSIYNEYIELTYYYGWVDCISGCWYSRIWVFKVHPGCDVEYVGSYGDPVPADLGLVEEQPQPITVWPNPFRDHFEVSGAPLHGSYKLYNTLGQLVQSGTLDDNGIVVERELPPGPYLLQLQFEGKAIRSYHLIKD